MIDKKQIEFTEHYYDNGDSFVEAKLVLKTGMSIRHMPEFISDHEVKLLLAKELFHNVYGDLSKSLLELLSDTELLFEDVVGYAQPWHRERFQKELDDYRLKINSKIEEMNLHEVFS